MPSSVNIFSSYLFSHSLITCLTCIFFFTSFAIFFLLLLLFSTVHSLSQFSYHYPCCFSHSINNRIFSYVLVSSHCFSYLLSSLLHVPFSHFLYSFLCSYSSFIVFIFFFLSSTVSSQCFLFLFLLLYLLYSIPFLPYPRFFILSYLSIAFPIFLFFSLITFSIPPFTDLFFAFPCSGSASFFASSFTLHHLRPSASSLPLPPHF